MPKRKKNPVIVVGFDGSESSLKAVDYSKAMAHLHSADIHLLHVIDWSPYEFYSMEETATRSRERKREIQQDRENLFPAVLADLKKSGIQSVGNVTFGHPSQALARAAKNVDAIMMIVGRRGRSKIRRMLMGSVAASLANYASCPVVIVP